ncbi:MAG: serine--tRNA ligase [Clostridia bacterium]|nr:serine--tRNA ligase [Clostridia bacterium]
MLDIKKIRENPQLVKQAMINRNSPMDDQIDEILKIDEQRRSLMTKAEQMKAEQNKANKQIPAFKKQGLDVSELLSKMKDLSNQITTINQELSKLEEVQKNIILSIPNIPNESVPVGTDDSQNTELRRWGEIPSFDFEPKPHWDIGANLDILDAQKAAKVTGKRFHFYKGLGARLERAIINFFLDTHTQNGYFEIMPPYMVNRASMTGTGQLPKFEEDAFKLANADYFLIPTAEVPVTNYHRDEILNAKDLPISYCAYSACFRAEAGSAGRDTRGLIRQHQFNKVELVKFSKPENSYEQLEQLTLDAQKVLQLLGLPHRVVCLCSGDLGFSSAKTYDIEVWMPSYNKYVEISSCSNFEDFQARRAAIRYKENPKDKAKLIHTLNGSGVAVGRTVAAILENFQNQDGSVNIPAVLQKYMGCDKIQK